MYISHSEKSKTSITSFEKHQFLMGKTNDNEGLSMPPKTNPESTVSKLSTTMRARQTPLVQRH